MYTNDPRGTSEPYYKPPGSPSKLAIVGIAVVVVLLVLIFLYVVVAPLFLGPAIGNIFSNITNTL